jgi:hypothetical protein
VGFHLYATIKTLDETSLLRFYWVQMEDMDAEPMPCPTNDRFPNLPSILSAYSEMPERMLWLVEDSVMKSELPERLPR